MVTARSNRKAPARSTTLAVGSCGGGGYKGRRIGEERKQPVDVLVGVGEQRAVARAG
jgi:hypothetical protein